MLRTLRIRDLVILEDVTVEFAPGLNLLTGETGAGKSVLVDALGLISGQRADRSLVRAGASRAILEAFFEIGDDPLLRGWAEQRQLEEHLEDGELLVRREVPAEGNGRVAVNGSPCTLALLREWGGRLLELQGQQEHQSLLSPERHLALLDRFAGHDDLVAEVGETHGGVLRAHRRREELASAAARRGERIEALQAVIREIDALAPEPGELERLDRERSLLRNSARVLALLDELVELTYEGERGAGAQAAAAARRAAELAQLDPTLAEAAQRLEQASVELQDVGSLFRDYRERGGFDPGRLEEVEARRAALERLCLRYGEDEEAVLRHRDEASDELDSLRGIEDELLRAEEALREAERAYLAADARLRTSREEAAAGLVPALERQLGALALKKARFEVDFPPARGEEVQAGSAAPVALHPRGSRGAAFLLAPNPGEPLAPLHRAASGGELSRVLLALHAVIEGAGEGRVLVFDEVDAGVGGAAADAVGARLSGLARRHQVLCVTHLPQVAAHGERHLAVRKSVRGGRTRAEIRSVEGDERVAELARMLGGKRATPTSRRHASELLAAASGRRSASGRRA